MSHLFSPLQLRGVTLPNRIMIAPMSQYAACNGVAGDWHLANAGRFAMGGAGMVMIEATSVTRDGRGTTGDLGLWDDAQIEPLARIARFLAGSGSVPAIQLNHAGRKSGRARLSEGGASLGVDEDGVAWTAAGPTAAPWAAGQPEARAMTIAEIEAIAEAWSAAAARAVRAGFAIIEVHAAHGYLLHQFYSPLANLRADAFGGDRNGRMRFPLLVAERVRAAIPPETPLLFRISVTDWADNGWTVEDSIILAGELADRGVDAIDCSSGGLARAAAPPTLGHQLHLAARIRSEANIPTVGVGHILSGGQAEAALAAGEADLIAIGREALVNSNWAHHARWDVEPEAGRYAQWPITSGWWLERRQIESRP